MATDRPRAGSDSDADLGDDRVRDDEYERDFGDASRRIRSGRRCPTSRRRTSPRPGGPRPHSARREQRAAAAAATSGTSTAAATAPARASSAARGLPARVLAELRRVQWPDRRQVGQGTRVTLGFVVVAGAYLGLLDAIWNPIIQAISVARLPHMFRWYVINTYSGHENKVKQNLEHRVSS
jgi:preprotein translocase SecE subunit